MKVSKEACGLFLLIIVAFIVQFTVARRGSLWADEVFSLAMATGHSLEHRAADAQPQLGDFVEPEKPVPAAEFRRYVQHDTPPASPARVVRAVLISDTSPPLYYLLLEAWTLLFGTSDLALRLFSVTFSIASLPLLAALARRIANKVAAVASCVFFTFSPLVIYYSTEGRMYSLLIFLTIATALVSLVLQERGSHVGYCALWVGLTVAGFLTHYFFVFPWVAIVVFLFVYPGNFQRRWLLLCALLTGVLILPWVWVAYERFGSWKVTGGWLKMRRPQFQRIHALVAQFTQFFNGDGYGLWRIPRWPKLSATLLFAVAAISAAWRLRRQLFSGRVLLLWLWLIAACGGPTAIDLLQHTYTANFPRYALGGVPAACLLGGIFVSSIGRGWAVPFASLVVLAWSPALHDIYRRESRAGEPMRQVAQVVSAAANSSDLVLVHSVPTGVIGIARYAKTPARFASWIQPLGNRRVPESLQTLAQGYNRVLLVKIHTVGAPAPEEEWLRANATLLNQKRIQSSEVIEFELNPSREKS